MLGKAVVVVGAGAALVLWTRTGREQCARLVQQTRVRGAGRSGTVPPLVDRRPQALESRPSAAPLLLPDATPTEIARAVLDEHPNP